MSDIDTAVVDSLKVLDLKWPIREADIVALASESLTSTHAFALKAQSNAYLGLLEGSCAFGASP